MFSNILIGLGIGVALVVVFLVLPIGGILLDLPRARRMAKKIEENQ